MSGQTFPGSVNPLVFFGVENPGGPDTGVPGAEEILRHLTTPGEDGSPEAFQHRCKELAASDALPIVPREEHTLTRLIWPLRHAKVSYCVGNYFGALALCGMVSEMVAITYFDASNFEINGQPMDDKLQKQVFGGKTFEGLGQDRKLAILEAYSVIAPDDAKELDAIRVKRNNYLHWASRPQESIKDDAREVYEMTCRQVSKLILKGFDEGKIVFNVRFASFLVRRGFLKPT